MPERPSSTPDRPRSIGRRSVILASGERGSEVGFDLSTVMGIPVHSVQVSKEVAEMTTAYFAHRTMEERVDKASDACRAEHLAKL